MRLRRSSIPDITMPGTEPTSTRTERNHSKSCANECSASARTTTRRSRNVGSSKATANSSTAASAAASSPPASSLPASSNTVVVPADSSTQNPAKRGCTWPTS